jgi:tetratricopeptide (TPR) repeat protein
MDRSDFTEAMRTARGVFIAGDVDAAGGIYNGLIAELRGSEQYVLATTAMLEYGIHLASIGDHARATQVVDAGETLAIEAGVPTERGDFAFAHAEIYTAKGDHLEATQKYVDAMEQYVACDRVYEFAGAASRYAFAVDRMELEADAVRAHELAIRAVRNLPEASEIASKIIAVHLGQIGRAQMRAGRPLLALTSFLEQREIYEAVGSAADVAGTDVEIGNVYIALDSKRLALASWDSALALYEAVGAMGNATQVRDAIAQIDGSAPELGQEIG